MDIQDYINSFLLYTNDRQSKIIEFDFNGNIILNRILKYDFFGSYTRKCNLEIYILKVNNFLCRNWYISYQFDIIRNKLFFVFFELDCKLKYVYHFSQTRKFNHRPKEKLNVWLYDYIFDLIDSEEYLIKLIDNESKYLRTALLFLTNAINLSDYFKKLIKTLMLYVNKLNFFIQPYYLIYQL